MAIITGYSRGTWNQSAWNEAIPVDITGEELNSNTGIVAVLEGTGNVISITTNLININIGNVTCHWKFFCFNNRRRIKYISRKCNS
jgi:hypothetical protein